MREARAIVGRGLLGPLVSVEMRMLTTQVRFRDPSSWLFRRELSGGGVLSWLGCHDLDLVRYVAQDGIVSVAAEWPRAAARTSMSRMWRCWRCASRRGAVGSLHIAYTLALAGGGYHTQGGYDTYLGFSRRNGRMYWGNAAPRLHVGDARSIWAAAPKRALDFALADSPAYGGVAGEQFVRDFIRGTPGQWHTACVGPRCAARSGAGGGWGV